MEASGAQPVTTPHSALRTPRSSAPDHLVDPNLLAPPPPRAQPKPTQVTIICRLCGTRLYAPLAKVGQTIKCADCHTINEIEEPKEAKKKPEGPTLEGAEDYGMSAVVERPAYRPLQAARGDYEILAALDPAHVEHGWAIPTTSPDRVNQPAPEAEDEMRLEAPAERVLLAPPPSIALPAAPPDPEDALRDGRYDDDLIGDNVDPRQPDAWKKAPFVYGIVEFLFYPSTLSRWLGYGFALAIPLTLFNWTYEAATNDDPSGKVLAVVLAMFCSVSLGLVMAAFCAALVAIVQDTANGSREASSWPDWNPGEWFFQALMVPIAALLSGLPGMLVTSILFGSGLDPRVAVVLLSLPLPVSWLFLFPVVFYSMLAEASMMAPVSSHALRSFKTSGEGWMLFYLYSMFLFILAGAAVSLVLVNHVAACAVGAFGLVTVAFLYARLLGRLMWYAAQQEAKQEALEARRALYSQR